MSIAIPASVLKPLAAIAAKWAESALKRWLDRRRERRKAAGKWMRPVAGILLVAGLSGCGTLNLLLDRATDAWMPEAGAPASTNAPPSVVTNAPPTDPAPHKPEGREIETIKVDGDGLWKPDTKTYLVPTRQRTVAPGPGWSANGQRIMASHIRRAVWCGPDGTVRGSLRWPGKPGTEDERNYYGSWVRLLGARCASGDTVKVYDTYGQQIAELRVPDAAKRAEGRR